MRLSAHRHLCLVMARPPRNFQETVFHPRVPTYILYNLWSAACAVTPLSASRALLLHKTRSENARALRGLLVASTGTSSRRNNHIQ